MPRFLANWNLRWHWPEISAKDRNFLFAHIRFRWNHPAIPRNPAEAIYFLIYFSPAPIHQNVTGNRKDSHLPEISGICRTNSY
jgi:hypothetical protein